MYGEIKDVTNIDMYRPERKFSMCQIETQIYMVNQNSKESILHRLRPLGQSSYCIQKIENTQMFKSR